MKKIGLIYLFQTKNFLKGKKTLVLDLDETLVHSSHLNNHADFALSV